MKITSSISTFVGCTLLGAGIGGGIGYALGKLAPGYYRSVFVGGNEPSFDPVAVGIGQGITQGAAGGIVVGLALVVLFIWRDVRMAVPVDPLREGTPRRRKISVGLLVFAAIVAVLGLGSACIVVDVFVRPEVWLNPQRQLDRNETRRRIERLRNALENYAGDHGGRYPSKAQGLNALYMQPEGDAAWEGPYSGRHERDLNDVWGTPLSCAEPAAESESRKPSIWSFGPDKAPNTSDDVR